MKQLFKLSKYSFRAQLIYGIGFFLTLLLGAFIYIETTNNSQFLRQRALVQASNHSIVLASMSKAWVMSNDYAGLEEALDNFSAYNDLVFAAVINMDGKVIAHTDKSLVGKYISDERRISFLRRIHTDNLENQLDTFRQGYNIDTMRLIHNEDEHIGFVHIRFDQHAREKQISDVIFRGIGFGLLYLVLTYILLYFIVKAFTRQLGNLLGTVKKVHGGDKEVRADGEGFNELSSLSCEFNAMLDAIASGELALKSIKERLEYAIQGSNDGLWDWDLQTNQVYFSPRWKEMLGYLDDELPNTLETWSKNVHPDDIESALKAVNASHSNPELPYEVTHRLRHKNGSWVWILARGQTIFDEAGKAIRMVGFHTDITKQKELEDELKKTNEHLQELVDEETSRRLEKERLLLQQSKMAMMGEMIGAIAHQWRQPLNSLGITVQDVEAAYKYGELNEKYIHDFKIEAMAVIQKMSRTIDDFRSFFRPNKDKEWFMLEKAINDTINIIHPQLKNHFIDLNFDAQAQTSIYGYKSELEQVLLIIISNSKDALIENNIKEPVIDITIDSTDESKVILSIQDNGGGIEAKILDRIFEPYFTTKGQSKGTGIGLYIAKEIIERHMNGKIWAENRGLGARVVVELNKIEQAQAF